MRRAFPALMGRLGMVAALAALATACKDDEGARATPDPAAPAARGGEGSAARAAPKGRVEIIAAPDEDDTAGLVKRELERAKADGRTLLVYVGATWCEPCERFHNAAKAGELDESLPGLRLLEFDADRDRARLKKAGYGSKMIPLFALPGEDGTSSGAQIQGGIKGDRAVGDITARLHRLLATGQAEL